jgi:hypothetical protein
MIMAKILNKTAAATKKSESNAKSYSTNKLKTVEANNSSDLTLWQGRPS